MKSEFKVEEVENGFIILDEGMKFIAKAKVEVIALLKEWLDRE